MIDAEFERIIRRMANDMGKSIFAEAKFKALLKDYAKNDFKKESTLLLTVVDAGCVKYINEAKNLAECKQADIVALPNPHFPYRFCNFDIIAGRFYDKKPLI
jgi:hypothetical protein